MSGVNVLYKILDNHNLSSLEVFQNKNGSKCPLCDIFLKRFKKHYAKVHNIGKFDLKLSACEIFFYCKKCNSICRRFYYANARGTRIMHNCTKIRCNIYKKKCPFEHNCFIPIIDRRFSQIFTKNPDEKCEIYVYDFETNAEPNEMGILKPYYCTIYKFCNVCMNEESRKQEYECCKVNTGKIFKGETTLIDFGEYFFKIANSQINSRWFAHNRSKFDNLYLLHYLICEKKLLQ